MSLEVKQFLNIRDVSHYLKIPRETLYKYVRSGRIPASKVGKHWRFSRDEIDHWVSQLRGGTDQRMRALVVDDEYAVQKIMSRWLGEAGCEVVGATSGREALDLIRDAHFDLVILDLMMPVMNGVETLRELKNISPSTIIVIATGYFDSQLMDDALDLGPIMAMKKPVDRDALMTLVNSLMSCGRSFSMGRG